MPKVNIDLAESNGMMEPVAISSQDVRFPTFHVELEEDHDFPHSGEMTIQFKKVASSMNRREGEKPRYSCTFEVRKIVELYPDETKEREPRTEEALDALAKEAVEKKKSKSEDY